MKKLILIYLLLTTLLFVFVAAVSSQNIIKNGDFSLDSNNDGIADHWYKGNVTPYAAIVNGAQVVYSPGASCSQSQLYQDVSIQNDKLKWYKMEFDLASKETVYVLMYWSDNFCYPVTTIYSYGNGMKHYIVIFQQQLNTIIKKISFTSYPDYYNWIKVDNVTMTEYPDTGLTAVNRVEYYDMRGNKLDSKPNKGYYLRVTDKVNKQIIYQH